MDTGRSGRFLKGALRDDPEFVRVFAENARRSWDPIWCAEAGLTASGEALDLAAWLGEA